MSGYVIAYAPCANCGVSFGCNPNKVPSVRIDGVREPICLVCIGLLNAERRDMGLLPFVPEPDAYEPLPESEL